MRHQNSLYYLLIQNPAHFQFVSVFYFKMKYATKFVLLTIFAQITNKQN